jgi:prepilin-type N-terminal cleavage/methylation domain-containing protein
MLAPRATAREDGGMTDHPSPSWRCDRAFTIVELLVVVAIIALLIGILLPAIGKARDQAKLTQSQANLRQIGQAHATYAGEWSDRHFTLVDDNFGRYGSNGGQAAEQFYLLTGSAHPGIFWGWVTVPGGYSGPGGNAGNGQAAVGYWFPGQGSHSGSLLEPMSWFRYYNVKQFNSYLSGRTYDPVFYAPKDRIAVQDLEESGCWEDASDICFTDSGYPRWSSYCLSPAALYSPDVMRPTTAGGWQAPFSLHAGFRVPSMSQARYPDLKTHMLEHHWLQQKRSDCNPAFDPNPVWACEPYYFNHSWESVPVTLFYDGHVAGLGVREAEAADTRLQVQAGHGLWSRDTPMGGDGYFIAEGYDFAATSFHVLTTEGVRGRDTLAR